ncbi:MAG: ArsR family transcriptional regulator [Dehalococcoidia bacterium]|nr:ArsR family transcriptional regulator [Dehalococcoidia bacterium]
MMQHTRWAILQILKRSGGNTVEELCHSLELAPMTVRQHLAVLEKDGHVIPGADRRGHGRPSHVYALSAAADELFPKSYDKLVVGLLRQIAQLEPADLAGRSPQERVSFVLERMAEGQGVAIAAQVQAGTLEQRGVQLADILNKHEGTLSVWQSDEDGHIMEDFNCPFRAVVDVEPELCQWHTRLLSTVLQADVKEESCIANGASCCRHRITERA